MQTIHTPSIHTNLIITDSYNLTDFRHDIDTHKNNAKHFNVSYKMNRKRQRTQCSWFISTMIMRITTITQKWLQKQNHSSGKLCKIDRNESTRFYLRGEEVKFNSQIDGLFFMAEVRPGSTTDVRTDKRLTAARRWLTHNLYTRDTQLTHKIQQSA